MDNEAGPFHMFMHIPRGCGGQPSIGQKKGGRWRWRRDIGRNEGECPVEIKFTSNRVEGATLMEIKRSIGEQECPTWRQQKKYLNKDLYFSALASSSSITKVYTSNTYRTMTVTYGPTLQI